MCPERVGTAAAGVGVCSGVRPGVSRFEGRRRGVLGSRCRPAYGPESLIAPIPLARSSGVPTSPTGRRGNSQPTPFTGNHYPPFVQYPLQPVIFALCANVHSRGVAQRTRLPGRAGGPLTALQRDTQVIVLLSARGL